TGLLGQLLQVRPVMHLQDGAIQLLDKPRSPAKALGLMTEIATSAETPMRLSVQAYGNPDVARTRAETLQEHSSPAVPVVLLPAVAADHLGLAALGVSIIPYLAYAG